MKIKPEKVYDSVFDAMKDCVDRMKKGEKNLIQDGDTIIFDEDDFVEFEVEVKDED